MEYLNGSIKHNKFNISKANNIYEDESIYIFVDGIKQNSKQFENIINLYNKHKEEFVNYLDEFINVFLYDKLSNTFIAVRDRTGTQAIYYYLDQENNLMFSNDFMNLIDKYKIDKEINVSALTMYFRNHYVNPPETIIKNVYKLVHGHYLIYKNNKLENREYYSIIDKFNKNRIDREYNFNEIKKTLNSKIESKVKEYLKLNSSKNTGFFISGGIDSSLVSAIASKVSKDSINTYSIGFYDEKINEANKSKRIAEYLKSNHHELYISENEAAEIIYKIPEYYNELFADPSEVATVILNEYAKKNNVELAITGDGADQLFCGAGVYDTLYKTQKIKNIINPFNIYISADRFNNRKLKYLFSNKSKYYASQCEMNDFDSKLEGLFNQTEDTRFKQEKLIKTSNLQERRMILDFDTFMCDRVVNKMNTAAHKNNIETRSPFLSKDIIEYSFKIPHKYKYYNKCKKYILKQLLYSYIPEKYFSDNKQGFSIPTMKWLKTIFKKDLDRFSAKTYLNKQGIFNYNKVQELLNKIDDKGFTIIIWDYFIFQLWYDKYIN